MSTKHDAMALLETIIRRRDALDAVIRAMSNAITAGSLDDPLVPFSTELPPAVDAVDPHAGDGKA